MRIWMYGVRCTCSWRLTDGERLMTGGRPERGRVGRLNLQFSLSILAHLIILPLLTILTLQLPDSQFYLPLSHILQGLEGRVWVLEFVILRLFDPRTRPACGRLGTFGQNTRRGCNVYRLWSEKVVPSCNRRRAPSSHLDVQILKFDILNPNT